MRPLLLFLLLLLLFPGLSVLIQWRQDGRVPQAWWQWALLVALPVAVWLYLRHFSVLACKRGCRPPH